VLSEELVYAHRRAQIQTLSETFHNGHIWRITATDVGKYSLPQYSLSIYSFMAKTISNVLLPYISQLAKNQSNQVHIEGVRAKFTTWSHASRLD